MNARYTDKEINHSLLRNKAMIEYGIKKGLPLENDLKEVIEILKEFEDIELE